MYSALHTAYIVIETSGMQYTAKQSERFSKIWIDNFSWLIIIQYILVITSHDLHHQHCKHAGNIHNTSTLQSMLVYVFRHRVKHQLSRACVPLDVNISVWL